MQFISDKQFVVTMNRPEEGTLISIWALDSSDQNLGNILEAKLARLARFFLFWMALFLCISRLISFIYFLWVATTMRSCSAISALFNRIFYSCSSASAS